MTDPVVGQDASFLYLHKEAGLPVFPQADEPSLLGSLLEARPEQGAVEWPDRFEGGLLHRLDNQTSGLVVAARTLAALRRGREAFESHELLKRYRLLTHKDVSWSEHQVDRPLAHDRRRRSRMVWQRGASTPHRGRWYPAVTRFERLGRLGDLHLWEATMSTGVMHQIRVHAASVGLPLAGDRLYGGGGDGRFRLHHRRIDGWPGDAPELPEDWPPASP